ncbi:MFS transporter [Intrasporangium calvum]|uniref:MFS transporter n=1 Tax=Intrasporangium calvum TaxID=53358 RepID=A0ABT5GCT4_9MICO|nr:MFS transporter [Intrasporangium calvum]MDC5696028.1 MFS transporter [Intrasporangium calvum]
MLAPSVRRGYGVGSVATGAFGTVPGLLLLPYLTDHIGIAAGLAGVIVFAPKAWDVILNPIAGRISDRSRHPDGRRRPFLVRAGLVLAVCFVVLFAGPTSPAWAGAAWVALAYLACATAYAFFQVPYVAMPAEMTDDYDERTRLMTWRVAILALAILVSGGASPAIRDVLGPEWGYRAVGVFVGLLIAVGALGAWRGTRSAPALRDTPAEVSFGDQLRVVRSDRPFRLLLTTFVIQALATGAMLAGVDYVSRWVIGTPLSATLLFVCFVAPALLVTPLWQRFGTRLGKQRGYLVASLFLGGGALVLVLARSLPDGATYAAVALVGVGYAGAQMFPMAMLPDVASRSADTRTRIGLYTGVWTAGETLGLALGPGLYAAVLALGGYVSSSAGSASGQTDSAVTAIVVGFSLVPAVLVALSLLALRAYPGDALGPGPHPRASLERKDAGP